METYNEDALISIYEERPVLWDNRLKDYHNRDKRRCAVEEIAKVLNMSVDEVKKKIHSLRTSFMNEKKRLAKRKSIHSGGNFKKSKKFQALHFLDPVCFPATSTTPSKTSSYKQPTEVEDRAEDDTKEPLKYLQKQNAPAPVVVAPQKQNLPTTSTFGIHLESLLNEFPKDERDEFEADILAQAYAKKREILKKNK